MRSFRKESRATWRHRVEDWKESGLNVREFCRRQGIAETRFYDWRKRFGFGAKAESTKVTVNDESAKPAINFLPVQIKELPANETPTRILTSQRVEIFLNNGSLVRISCELSDDNLSKIMKLAGAPC
jgi:transposase-like protein